MLPFGFGVVMRWLADRNVLALINSLPKSTPNVL